jgi:hypothetical protein
MGLNYNDLTTRAYSVAVADADGVAGPCRVFGMYLTAAAADATLTINNAATKAGGGTTITLFIDYTLNVNNAPASFNFGPNGIRFATGLSVTLSGVGATCVVTYMEE